MIALNVQPAERQSLHPRGDLEVFHTWLTLQGEGPFAGTPAVFVRLSGCNLCCPNCDTDYTSTREVFTSQDLVSKVKSLAGANVKLVVITGGEPFRQNVTPFVNGLMARRLTVQIETNGGLSLDDFPYCAPSHKLSIVCSPKTGSIHHKVASSPRLSLKYVLEAGHVSEDDGLPTSVLGMTCRVARPPAGFGGEVFVQPQDDQDEAKNAANVKAAVESCMKFNYRLSLQTHKILGME